MFSTLFDILDIPLILLLVFLSFSAMFFIKDTINLFLSLLISILIIIFSTSIILVQQRFLGEFLIVSIFFIFAILFFIFNLNKEKMEETFLEKEFPLYKKSIFVIFFIIIFLTVGFNFFKLDKESNAIIQPVVVQVENNKNIVEIDKYNEYEENISLLNQNKIFQKLTHIIMFYICVIVVLYFLNKAKEEK